MWLRMRTVSNGRKKETQLVAAGRTHLFVVAKENRVSRKRCAGRRNLVPSFNSVANFLEQPTILS